MNEKEKEILDEIAKELDIDSVIVDINGFYHAQDRILRNISSRLPPGGKIKKFFEEIESMLTVRKEVKELGEAGKNIINENDPYFESMDIFIEIVRKVIKIFQGVEKRFDTSQYPQEIPQQIIQAYQAYLNHKIEKLEAALGLLIVHVRVLKEMKQQ